MLDANRLTLMCGRYRLMTDVIQRRRRYFDVRRGCSTDLASAVGDRISSEAWASSSSSSPSCRGRTRQAFSDGLAARIVEFTLGLVVVACGWRPVVKMLDDRVLAGRVVFDRTVRREDLKRVERVTTG